MVDATKNSGQLAQVESWIGTEKQYRQQYHYDCLSRILRSVETFGTSLSNTAYDVNYVYDVFGNREQHEANNSGNSTITQKWVESGDISKTNNRYTSGVTYDGAGNITADPRFRNLLYGYDANGRQNYTAQANGSSPEIAIFDGAGQRVAVRSAGGYNIMVYDAGGKLAAEYAQVTPPTSTDIQYVTANYQGSTSVVTDNGGAVKARHDYLPFGEEIGAGVGSRNGTKMFSQTDGVRQKYAGMETDDATGMAHTLWRKQDNWSGRWTSPDPYGGSMYTADPQSFNRYTYCDNDPINSTDALGLMAGADVGYQGFGGFGGVPGFTDSHFGGPAIIAEAEGAYDQRLADTRYANYLNGEIAAGRMTRDQALDAIKDNDNLKLNESPLATFMAAANSGDSGGGSTSVLSASVNSPQKLEAGVGPTCGWDEDQVAARKYIAGLLGWTYDTEKNVFTTELAGYELRSKYSWHDDWTRLYRAGFMYFQNLNPTEHWDATSFEGKFRGRWYHVLLGDPQGNWGTRSFKQRPGSLNMHAEERCLQPSSIEHGVDYLERRSPHIFL
jgi:RHS repeat-associated protein